ncbi:DUF1311 domain-containing protein [Bradyrhizobium jicamae]|uniref:DUF1311 domain-containing protein n=1 Tax=Bradyrhizobium jicamae TaxID=280332 RepID=A0ABS5FT92_9BRAD|nr:lysozyme inhibitor LprI family protein [Bradyrhizobium jicamae]MBR0800010.1 DUF1311 domain-containing protein [Bradyrhizobium jicamae]MBR0932054.1 DUF1311 domain-containing protein [Bradyrhizobium jicamae]
MLTALGLSPSGRAADFTVDLKRADCQLRMDGEIVAGDFDKFRKKLPRDYPPIEMGPTLCLNSPGGDFVEGLNIARFVSGGISTSIAAGNACESACGWIFLAGLSRNRAGTELSRTMDARATLSFHAPYIDPDKAATAAATPTTSGSLDLKASIQAYNQAVGEIGRDLLALAQKYATLDVSQPLVPPTLLAEALVKVGKDKLLVNTTGSAIRWSIRVTGYKGLVPRTKADVVRACITASALADQFWDDGFLSASSHEEYLAHYDSGSRTLVAEVVVSGIKGIACELEFNFADDLASLNGDITVRANVELDESVTRTWIRDRYGPKLISLPDFGVLDPKTPLKDLPAAAGKPIDPRSLATVQGPAWCAARTTRSKDEEAICASGKLSLYDVLLTRYYGEAIGKGGNSARSKLESEQRTWLEWRRACADDGDCLEAAYHLRIKQMKDRLDDASGVRIGHP